MTNQPTHEELLQQANDTIQVLIAQRNEARDSEARAQVLVLQFQREFAKLKEAQPQSNGDSADTGSSEQ